MVEFIFDSKFGGRREYKAPFEGVIVNLERRYRETNSDYSREKIEEYMAETLVINVKVIDLRKKFYQF